MLNVIPVDIMYDWHSFDVVFQAKPDYAYESKTVNTILKHREELGGTLFFDRVWSTLGLKEGMSFRRLLPRGCFRGTFLVLRLRSS